MNRPVLVVVPAYNEAETIEEVVRGALEHADVCVVDDGSRDATPDLVEAIPGAHCIRHQKNTHITGAIRDGFLHASAQGYSHCITMDAGMSHDPAAISSFLASSDADLVLGCRADREGVPLYRRALSFGAAQVVNPALGRSWLPFGGSAIDDVTSGFRMYSRAAYELIAHANLRAKSFGFHLEALGYVVGAGMQVTEVPIHYRFTNSSLTLDAVRDAARAAAHLWSARLGTGTLD